MSTSNIVSASFPSARYATAAVDWFLNQAIDRNALTVDVVPPGAPPRPPRPGDNRRTDLEWRVSIDLNRTKLGKQIALETMRREGGRIMTIDAAGM